MLPCARFDSYNLIWHFVLLSCKMPQWTASSGISHFHHVTFCNRCVSIVRDSTVFSFIWPFHASAMHHFWANGLIWNFVLPSWEIPKWTTSSGKSVLWPYELLQTTFFCHARLCKERPLLAKPCFCASVTWDSPAHSIICQFCASVMQDYAADDLIQQFHASIMQDSAADGFIQQFYACVMQDSAVDSRIQN